MGEISLSQIEQVITKAKPEQQRRLLANLPRLLKFSAEDFSLMKLAEPSFGFWDNTEDQIYDTL